MLSVYKSLINSLFILIAIIAIASAFMTGQFIECGKLFCLSLIGMAVIVSGARSG